MIREDLLLCKLNARDFDDAISQMGKIMQDKGFVKDSYINAVQQREKGFPTGLEADTFSIAIPHTDPEHVIKSAITVANLVSPIKIKSMSDPDKELSTQLVFLIAVDQPSEQLHILTKLMGMLQNKTLMQSLHDVSTPEAMYQLLEDLK